MPITAAKKAAQSWVAPAHDLAEKHDFPGLVAVARESKRGRDKQSSSLAPSGAPQCGVGA
jgi:hypothetical protein